MKKTLLSIITAASLGLAACGQQGCLPSYHVHNTLEARETTVSQDLEKIARSVYCLRHRSEYSEGDSQDKPQKMISHGTALAYLHQDGYTYLITNAHNITSPDQIPDITLKRSPEGSIIPQFKIYTKTKDLLSLVDNSKDVNEKDDLDLETVLKDERMDIAIVRTKKLIPTANAYLRSRSSVPGLGEEAYVIGYPRGLLKAVTKGSMANLSHYYKGQEYQVLDITATFGNSGSPYFIRKGNRMYFGGIVSAVIPYTKSDATLLTIGIPFSKFSPLLAPPLQKKNGQKKS